MLSRVCPFLLGWVPRDIRLLYPFYLAGHLNTVEAELPCQALPEALDGLSVAFASDIHYGPLLGRREALRLYERLLALQADLCVLGGDYGDTVENAVLFFEQLPPFPPGRPVVAVLGNHDYGRSRQPDGRLLLAMRDKNVIPLVNQTHCLTREGAVVAVCGPDDFRCGKPDLGALGEQSKDADFVLFIPHSPDILPLAAEQGFRFHLALCGHTHGGQIILFGRSLHSSSIYKDRYRSGWYREAGADILVSEGVGTSILPMRLGTRSQVHRLVLRAVPQREAGVRIEGQARDIPQ